MIGRLFGPARRGNVHPGAPGARVEHDARPRSRPGGIATCRAPVEPLEQRILLAASVVADIDPAVIAPGTRQPDSLTTSGNKVFFVAHPLLDLWVSDGTAAGTRQLPARVPPDGLRALADVNGTLYFSGGASDPLGGELWKSDGTPAGTARVKDINPGGASSLPDELVNVNGTLYFIATDASGDRELWKSGGTEASTVRVKDVRPGAAGSDPRSLTHVNGTLFFVADDGASGYELWKSDGTAAGTVRVKDIFAGPGTSGPASLVSVNNTLFFTANDGYGGYELWRSDGTAAGTYSVKDIRPGASGSAPTLLAAVGGALGGVLYFTADDGVNGYELWKSDGTAPGTVLIEDITAGASGSGLANLTASRGRLFFTATSAYGLELWISDGTSAGTYMVKDAAPGAANSAPKRLIDVGGTLYFTATDAATGEEVWRSDGTEAGTVRVIDAYPGPDGSQPSSFFNMAAAGGSLFFVAADRERWRLYRTQGPNGPASEVTQVTTFASPYSSGPASLLEVNGTVYFTANDGRHGIELWKTNGTTAGTSMVADFAPGEDASSWPTALTEYNNSLVFLAASSLWKTDGAGTVRLTPAGVLANGSELTIATGRVFFTAFYGTQLWTTNGTPQGTYRVLPRDTTAGLSRISELTATADAVYFVADDGRSGDEVWRSDGTQQGTALVRDLAPGRASSGPWELTGVGNTLFFRATDGVHGWELFKTNGTAAGTVLVEDVFQGSRNSGLGSLTDLGGTLLFTADDGNSGIELWRSDGTAEGTFLLKDIFPGPRGGAIYHTAVLNNVLYFRADDGVSGYELWRSDGTSPGTYRVKDIRPGPGGAAPQSLFVSDGALFFFADDGTGRRLWQTDGTAVGTFPSLGAGSVQFPSSAAKLGDTLVFSAWHGAYGHELWRADYLRAPSTAATVYGDGGTALLTEPDGAWSTAPAAGGATPAPPRPQWMPDLPGTRADGPAGAAPPLWPTLGPPRSPWTASGPTGAASRPVASDDLPGALLEAAQAADIGGNTASLTSPLRFYNALIGPTPQLSSYGLAPMFVSYTGHADPGDIWNFADEGRVRGLARAAADAGIPLVFDIEHWPQDIRYYSDGHVQVYVEWAERLADWAHDERPNLKVGFYDLLPSNDYWTPVWGTPSQVAAWAAANQRLQSLADKVDIICPSLYAFYDDRTGWRLASEGKLREAAKYGKPVVPFLGMMYDAREQALVGAEVPADFWQLQLKTVAAYTNEVALWAWVREPWDDNDPWWAVTREAMAQSQLPSVVAASFDHQTARDLRFTFSGSVGAGLDSGDLLLLNRTTGGLVVTSTATVGFDPVSRVATFTLPARLADGDYRATIAAAGVGMAADYVLDFAMLAGDINRDRAVNGADFAILAGNFGTAGKSYAQGDLTGDGRVDGSDFALLAGNFGKMLPALPLLESAPVAPAPASVTAAPQPAAQPAASPAAPRRRVTKPAPVKQPVPLKRRAAKIATRPSVRRTGDGL